MFIKINYLKKEIKFKVKDFLLLHFEIKKLGNTSGVQKKKEKERKKNKWSKMDIMEEMRQQLIGGFTLFGGQVKSLLVEMHKAIKR